jgi:uncharacterized protein
MKVVIDTNVFIASYSRKSEFHAIFQDLLAGKYQLFVSTAIMLEYQEIIALKYGVVGKSFFEDVLNASPNVIHVEPFINWQIIVNDPDDNKFVDCAICGGADFIVTNDNHFRAVKENEFPPMEVINMKAFIQLLENQK